METDLDHDDEAEHGEDEGDQDQAQGNNLHRITMMYFFAYRLQYRIGDSSEYMFRSRGHFRQLMVNMFCTMNMNHPNYLKHNQQNLRIELYSGNQGSHLRDVEGVLAVILKIQIYIYIYIYIYIA
jgi:hypothetical protein